MKNTQRVLIDTQTFERQTFMDLIFDNGYPGPAAGIEDGGLRVPGDGDIRVDACCRQLLPDLSRDLRRRADAVMHSADIEQYSVFDRLDPMRKPLCDLCPIPHFALRIQHSNDACVEL